MTLNILALSPHTDDAELCAGGSLARWLAEGHDVTTVAFSVGNHKTGALRQEFTAAMDRLGIINHELYTYTTRHFSEDRQHILDRIWTLRTRIRPDLVLVPCTADRHQDHQVITAEAVRAFRGINCSILGYASSYSHTLPVALTCFVALTEEHLTTKIAVVQCYRSQANKPYTSESFLRSLAQVYGVQGGMQYAEAFEVIRWAM